MSKPEWQQLIKTDGKMQGGRVGAGIEALLSELDAFANDIVLDGKHKEALFVYQIARLCIVDRMFHLRSEISDADATQAGKMASIDRQGPQSSAGRRAGKNTRTKASKKGD